MKQTSVAQDSRFSRVLSWSCLESKTRPRQDCYTQDQDQDKIKNVKTKTKTRLAQKFQEILSRVLKILEFIFFTDIVQKRINKCEDNIIL